MSILGCLVIGFIVLRFWKFFFVVMTQMIFFGIIMWLFFL